MQQMTFDFTNAADALAALMAMPTIAEMDREIEETVAVLEAVKATRNATPYGAWGMRSSFVIPNMGITADAVTSIAGDFLYYIVTTPLEIKEIVSLIGLETAITRGGSHMLARCSIVASVASVADLTLDTDNLDCVKDINPDEDLTNFDELEEAVEA